MVVCVNLLFAAGHITEAASKHQIHLFVRFVIAILLYSRILNASYMIVHRATGVRDNRSATIIVIRCVLCVCVLF